MEQITAGNGVWVGGGSAGIALDNSQAIAQQQFMADAYAKRADVREDQELRLKCLQTTLQFASGDMAKATNAAQIAYDFITGKRSLSEVQNGE